MDGLRSEIRAAVVIQRPSDLDTACVLALLQEEVLDRDKKKDFRKVDYSVSRPSPKSPMPLPLPPGSDKAPVHSVEHHRSKPPDDKFAALRAYRRAKGLCVKYAEKWHRDHKCPDAVQLHVLQELYELFQLEDDTSEDTSVSTPPQEQLFLSISEAAWLVRKVLKLFVFWARFKIRKC